MLLRIVTMLLFGKVAVFETVLNPNLRDLIFFLIIQILGKLAFILTFLSWLCVQSIHFIEHIAARAQFRTDGVTFLLLSSVSPFFGATFLVHF